jgi:dihydropteroate synthase
MITKTLNCSPQEALNGTSILNTLAFTKGARIFRVHDVVAAREIILLFEAQDLH